MNRAWWLVPSIVIGTAIWCFIFASIPLWAAILIILAFGAGIWWAAWWLEVENGR